MKKILKTLALVAIGVAVGRVIKDRNKYFIEGQQLRKDVSSLQDLINQYDKL